MSLFAMIPLGIGEIIGALLMGNLRDKFGYQTTLKILLPATLVAFAMVFGTIASYSFNTLSFLMTFVWGF
jgi:predicted MFS family arabinose efflux permease